jgi:hypothetical protein
MSNYETIKGQTFLKVENYFFDLLPNEMINLINDFRGYEPENKKKYKSSLEEMPKYFYENINIIFLDDEYINIEEKHYYYLNKECFKIEKKKYFYEFINEEELKEKITEILKESIFNLYSDIDDYKRCLEDKYYIKNNFNNGMKERTIKKLLKYIEDEDGEKIFNMLDYETFIFNYGRFNDIGDLLYNGILINLYEGEYIFLQEL